jgi:hypothetical protein
MDNKRHELFQEIADFVRDFMPDAEVLDFDENGVFVNCERHDKVANFSVIWSDLYRTILTWVTKDDTSPHQCPVEADTFLRWAMMNNLVIHRSNKDPLH